MLAVLPDTQVYSLLYPGIYTAQTAWIASHVQDRRIPYVLHLGDIVDTNTHLEWQRAAQAMSLLEGVVPYALATGNHDYGPAGNAANRDTLLNQYFSYERTAAWPTFGGAYEVGQAGQHLPPVHRGRARLHRDLAGVGAARPGDHLGRSDHGPEPDALRHPDHPRLSEQQ